MRLNRFMALKGIAARRKADELIAAGCVCVDGRVARVGERVEHPEAQIVMSPEAKIFASEYAYVAYYKPRGIVTHSPQGQEKSIEKVSGLKGVFPVGRLDKDSEGLILLTNDGRVTERLLSPRFQHEKEYLVTVKETLGAAVQRQLQAGIEDAGECLRAKRVVLLDRRRLSIVLTEGKRHQIRRMLGQLGFSVMELKRIRIMQIHLGSLKPGIYRTISGRAKAGFLRDLGLSL